MSVNYEKCVPGNNKELLYWPILNFYCNIPQICGGMLINKIVVLKIFDELFG
jgi:hypothetical protein